MTTLLELKEKLIRFYGKNEIYVKPAIRFVLALFTFLVINNSIGYMKLVSKTPVAVILALVCSMLPVNGLIAIAALVVLADLYALSIEVCLVGLLMFAIIYFIYFQSAGSMPLLLLIPKNPSLPLHRSMRLHSRSLHG
jgi:hypothetical protein